MPVSARLASGERALARDDQASAAALLERLVGRKTQVQREHDCRVRQDGFRLIV